MSWYTINFSNVNNLTIQFYIFSFIFKITLSRISLSHRYFHHPPNTKASAEIICGSMNERERDKIILSNKSGLISEGKWCFFYSNKYVQSCWQFRRWWKKKKQIRRWEKLQQKWIFIKILRRSSNTSQG